MEREKLDPAYQRASFSTAVLTCMYRIFGLVCIVLRVHNYVAVLIFLL